MDRLYPGAELWSAGGDRQQLFAALRGLNDFYVRKRSTRQDLSWRAALQPGPAQRDPALLVTGHGKMGQSLCGFGDCPLPAQHWRGKALDRP